MFGKRFGERFKVGGLLTVSGTGQIVLPKALRDRANIRAGDKLIAICFGEGDRSVIILQKVERVAAFLRSAFGPILREIVEEAEIQDEPVGG